MNWMTTLVHARSVLLLTALLVGLSSFGADVPPPPEPHAPEDVPALEAPEALTRGPIHEAYAEPVVFDPKPGPVIPKAVPQAIEELPPDQKPEGQSIVWIPGYWAWDEERADFLWISGLWRELPPDRQWVPGYWTEVQGGVQWVSGYWAPTQEEEASYLPAPPSSLEAGPNVPAPSATHIWTPGYWYFVEQRYVWRPGCWIACPQQWVWVPPHYVWSPCGHVFVPGYWDFTLAQRGMLFAPVYMPPVIIARPAFVFTPTVVIQNTVLVDNLFCRPGWGHYYFGDYFAPAYRQSGFFFSVGFNSTRFGFDPISAHYVSIQGGYSSAWAVGVRQRYDFMVMHVDARPARTFRAFELQSASRPRGGVPMAMALGEMAHARADIVEARQGASVRRAEIRTDFLGDRLERLDDNRRAQYASQAAALRDYRSDRLHRELELAKIRPARFETAEATPSASSPGGWRGQGQGQGRAMTTPSHGMNRPNPSVASQVASRSPEFDPMPVARRPMSRSPMAATSETPGPRPPSAPYLTGTRELPAERLRARSGSQSVASAPGPRLAQQPSRVPTRGGIPASTRVSGGGETRPLPSASPGQLVNRPAISRDSQGRSVLTGTRPPIRQPLASGSTSPRLPASTSQRPETTMAFPESGTSRPGMPGRPSSITNSRPEPGGVPGPRTGQLPTGSGASRSAPAMTSRSASREAARRQVVEELEARRERRKPR